MENENNNSFENNEYGSNDIETIDFSSVVDDPVISSNQGSLSSFFGGNEQVSNEVFDNVESNISNTDEVNVNNVFGQQNDISYNENAINQQQSDMNNNETSYEDINESIKNFQESYKTDNASSIIDDINSANLYTSSKKSSSKDDQPSGLLFVIILFIALAAFIILLPYISKLF